MIQFETGQTEWTSRAMLQMLDQPTSVLWEFGSSCHASAVRAQGSGFKVGGLGFRVQGWGFSVQGSRFRV